MCLSTNCNTSCYMHIVPARGAKYCDDRVCLCTPICLSVYKYISKTRFPHFAIFWMPVT